MNALFFTPLQVELVDSSWTRSRWRLLTPLVYHSPLLGEEIRVPAGFITDFASVPRLPVIYWLAGGTVHRPAVIHDYLYHVQTCPRLIADRVFLEASEVDGAWPVLSYPMFGAVAALGWTRWE